MLKVIGIVKNKRVTTGYRLYDEETTRTKDYNNLEVLDKAWEGHIENATVKHATLICDDEKLPHIDENTKLCINNDKIIVLGEIVNNGVLEGYRVTDYTGITLDLHIDKIFDLGNVGFYNAKIEGTKKKKVLVPLKGELRQLERVLPADGLTYFEALTQDPSLVLNGLLYHMATRLAEVEEMYNFPTAKQVPTDANEFVYAVYVEIYKGFSGINFVITADIDFNAKAVNFTLALEDKGEMQLAKFSEELVDKPVEWVNKTLGWCLGTLILISHSLNKHYMHMPEDQQAIKKAVTGEERVTSWDIDLNLASSFSNQLDTLFTHFPKP